MRFAVHGPGNPVASPRSHGVPRRDVDGRVHVRVAGETAGRAQEARLALARLPIHVPARRAPLARERGSDLLHPAGGLVLQPADQQPPAGPQDLPVQPGLLAGRCGPGSPACPSPTGSCYRSAGPRPGSHQSGARCRCWSSPPSPCAGPSRGPSAGRSRACTWPRRFDPAPGAGEPALESPQPAPAPVPVRAGQCSISPVDRAAETATPRSMPTTWPFPGAGTGSGMTAKATCQRPARSSVTRKDARPRARRGTSGTAPSWPSAPGPGRPVPGHAAYVPLPPARP